MISKIFSVFLFVGAISAGHQIGFNSVLPIQHQLLSVPVPSVPTLSAPIGSHFIQPIASRIPIPSALSPITFSGQLPRTVPQYLLSLPRNVVFTIPKAVPSPYLTIASPQVLSQPIAHPIVNRVVPAVQPFSSVPFTQTFVSPAQIARSKTFTISGVTGTQSIGQTSSQASDLPQSSPAQPDLSQSSPAQPDLSQSSPAQPDLSQLSSPAKPLSESNSNSQTSELNQGNTGFQTPFKPLNFAPNLPEVDKPVAQPQSSVESDQNPKLAETPEPVEQKLDSQKPEEKTEQNSFDNIPPQPLNQPKIETNAIPQMSNTLIGSDNNQSKGQSVGLSSYSF